MLRLAGILTGSAIAIAVLITALGLPQPGGASREARIAPLAGDEPAFHEPPVDALQTAVESENPMTREPESPAAPPAAIASEIDNGAAAQTDQADAAVDSALPADNPQAANWFAFWSPFRSEIAANGFVAELQRSTGLDYRVVKVKPGVYEVAFAYTSDTDRQDKLARISEATGLDIADG
jgi:hypothetical protein